jgi:hypothetical protein
MKFLLLLTTFIVISGAQAQRKPVAPDNDGSIIDVYHSIIAIQESMSLYTENNGNHTKEHDVNSIILDIEEKLRNEGKQTLTMAGVLTANEFAPMRLFFLSTTNKTSVATSFLYADQPYHFCLFHDTTQTLHFGAIKCGDVYDLSKITEKRAAKLALQNCLLPALKPLDEFKDGKTRYMALSIYYGCKDAREGASANALTPFCMTLLARLSDIQQYNAGIITAKGLLASAELYLSDEADAHELHRLFVSIE